MTFLAPPIAAVLIVTAIACGSCHKRKNGTQSGILSDGALTLALDVPAGGADITPLCGITIRASTITVAAGRIAVSYTGTPMCEGLITDGTLTVTRERTCDIVPPVALTMIVARRHQPDEAA